MRMLKGHGQGSPSGTPAPKGPLAPSGARNPPGTSPAASRCSLGSRAPAQAEPAAEPSPHPNRKAFQGSSPTFFASSEQGCSPRRCHCLILSGSAGRVGSTDEPNHGRHGAARQPETRRRSAGGNISSSSTNSASLGTSMSTFVTSKANEPHVTGQSHCKPTAARTEAIAYAQPQPSRAKRRRQQHVYLRISSFINRCFAFPSGKVTPRRSSSGISPTLTPRKGSRGGNTGGLVTGSAPNQPRQSPTACTAGNCLALEIPDLGRNLIY